MQLTLEKETSIQGDLEKLEKRAHENLMKFRKFKCKVRHLHQEIPDMSTDWEMNSLTCEEGLGIKSWIWVDEKLDMSQQFVFATQKSHCILGCMTRCGQ